MDFAEAMGVIETLRFPDQGIRWVDDAVLQRVRKLHDALLEVRTTLESNKEFREAIKTEIPPHLREVILNDRINMRSVGKSYGVLIDESHINLLNLLLAHTGAMINAATGDAESVEELQKLQAAHGRSAVAGSEWINTTLDRIFKAATNLHKQNTSLNLAEVLRRCPVYHYGGDFTMPGPFFMPAERGMTDSIGQSVIVRYRRYTGDDRLPTHVPENRLYPIIDGRKGKQIDAVLYRPHAFASGTALGKAGEPAVLYKKHTGFFNVFMEGVSYKDPSEGLNPVNSEQYLLVLIYGLVRGTMEDFTNEEGRALLGPLAHSDAAYLFIGFNNLSLNSRGYRESAIVAAFPSQYGEMVHRALHTTDGPLWLLTLLFPEDIAAYFTRVLKGPCPIVEAVFTGGKLANVETGRVAQNRHLTRIIARWDL